MNILNISWLPLILLSSPLLSMMRPVSFRAPLNNQQPSLIRLPRTSLGTQHSDRSSSPNNQLLTIMQSIKESNVPAFKDNIKGLSAEQHYSIKADLNKKAHRLALCREVSIMGALACAIGTAGCLLIADASVGGTVDYSMKGAYLGTASTIGFITVREGFENRKELYRQMLELLKKP